MSHHAILLADLGLGDSGKGTLIDYLSRETGAHTVVRYNGGPQAAHNVVTTDGRHHTFAQFGSGTLVAGVRTLLSRFMLINPLNMLKEERHLRALGITDALQRMQIDRRTLVITPFQRALNRLRELARADQRHGSCGEGIGECMADSLIYKNELLQAGDLRDPVVTRQKLRFLRDIKHIELAELRTRLPASELARQEMALFADDHSIEDCAEVYQHFASQVEILDEAAVSTVLAQPGTLLFEGAQGVLLDENYGFTPYTTWSTTTFANAYSILREHNYTGEITTLGVIRTYATRHGAGPFPTEAPELSPLLPERHNTWNDWQHSFRVGYFDLLATRYALHLLGQLDYLAVTHLDYLQALPTWKFCHSYLYHGQPEHLPGYFEHNEQRISKINAPSIMDLHRQDQIPPVTPSPANSVDRSGRSPSDSNAHHRPIRLSPDQVGERPPGSMGTNVHQRSLEQIPPVNSSPAHHVGRGGRSPSDSNAHRRPIPPPCDHVGERPPGSADDQARQQYQEQLTRRLQQCSPDYLTLPKGHPAYYLALLEEHLNVPILLTSSGPTAADKQIRK